MEPTDYDVVTPAELRERGYPMMSSADVIRLQEQQNAIEQSHRRADELQNITLKRFWQDVGNAIDGCMHDLLVVRKVSLAQAFGAPARLRGFGFLFVALGLAGLMACLILGLRTA